MANSNDVGHGGGPLVVCQRWSGEPFAQSPYSAEHRERLNLAVVRANGDFYWNIGNIPGSAEATANDLVLNYGQTYHVNGWAILSTFDGTRFKHDGTGHGMFVSIDNVNPF
ncbi:hypothetical protein [Mycobacterium sp. IS-1496]|uniref:hypothetical protein n=1 Tax=Mycobacterium sp. IS-1496 TaxID=1772284 RepID=UPI0012FC542E|nr:hypothetical protein [Mycobacterium sp. IS-1496]